MKTIAPKALHDLCQSGDPVRMLDVRTPLEHSQVHIPGVELVPLHELDPQQLAAAGWDKESPLFVVCKSGARASEAARQLERAGFSQCHVVDGGTEAWAEAGLPVNRGERRVIPLDRQVRILIGTLVLTGTLLGLSGYPNALWLAVVMGAGLIFSGITNWCGLGLLMARMPWNRG